MNIYHVTRNADPVDFTQRVMGAICVFMAIVWWHSLHKNIHRSSTWQNNNYVGVSPIMYPNIWMNTAGFNMKFKFHSFILKKIISAGHRRVIFCVMILVHSFPPIIEMCKENCTSILKFFCLYFHYLDLG